ncbi:MAG: hypothetical protein WC647_03955 [Desulfomonilaceae bacterium]|jgi:hypothetical protein
MSNSENRPFSVNISITTDKDDYKKNTYKLQFPSRDHQLILDLPFSEDEFEDGMKAAHDITYCLSHNKEPNPEMSPLTRACFESANVIAEEIERRCIRDGAARAKKPSDNA